MANTTYNTVEYNRENCLSNRSHSGEVDIHGPAIFVSSESGSTTLSVDYVYCVRCLLWPPQAADWPTRHRNYGWPDSAILDRVVKNGCDVVGVAHRHCRQHEWMGKGQWRLSFSRAEIVLVNSWMPLQQIIYHMSRYFIKTERLTECADNSEAGTLSNYHIKSLILWVCELKPRSWWTDDINLVRMCVQLLHILAEWLTYGRCQHYFINNCNLIDNSFNVTIIRDQLMSIDNTWLSMWFVDNYIRKCLHQNNCPQNISWLFDDVSTSMKLQDAVSALVVWKRDSSLIDLLCTFSAAEFRVALSMYTNPLTARSCVCWLTELTMINSYLSVYFIALAVLHVASRSLKHGLNDELMDILATLYGQFTDIRRYPYNSTSVFSLNIAAKLMKVVTNKPLRTMSLIEIELPKAYLYRALRCKDTELPGKCLPFGFVLHYRTVSDSDRSLYTGDKVTRSLTVQFTCCTR